jgi:hypothetical protein
VNNLIEQVLTAAILESTAINDGYAYRGSVDDLFSQVVDDFEALGKYRHSFEKALEFLIAKGLATPHRHSGVPDYVVINLTGSVEAAFLEPPKNTNDLSGIFEGLFGRKNWKYHVVGSYLELGKHWLEDYIRAKLEQEIEVDPVVPASDRLVPLDHNRPEHAEIAEALEIAIGQAQENRPNDVSGDEHASLVAGLRAARSLWDAYQLTEIQIKIGILMAVETAEVALKTSFQLVKGPLLMEALKAFFKAAKDGDWL